MAELSIFIDESGSDGLRDLQSFDSVKVYYDNGQQSIAEAVHKAVDFAFSRNAVV